VRKGVYYISEAVGTFVMMLVGLSAIALNFGTAFMAEAIPSAQWRLLLTGMLFAGGATLVVYSPVGRISGAHLNPAVSLAFLLIRKLGFKDAVVFMAMQVLGSVAAAFLFRELWGNHARQVRMGMTVPGAGWSIPGVCLVEVLITFLLVSVIFLFLHRRELTRYAGLAAGALVASLVFFTANISGTSLNPARSLGPALAAGDFSFLWIYLVAPMVGSLLAVGAQQMRSARFTPLCAKLHHRDEPCLYEDCEFCKPVKETESS
jgi:aquaporin Z